MTPQPPPRDTDPALVVVAPDVVARALVNDDARRVLVLWRDRRIRPALNEALLARYLRLLARLELGETLLRRWALWWTAPDRVLFTKPVSAQASALDLCRALATTVDARAVITESLPGDRTQPDGAPSSPPLLTPARFLDEHLPSLPTES